MNDFRVRLNKAQDYESALVEYLNQCGFVTAMNGTEHTHPEFVNQLRTSEDPTSLFIRFQPDGVAHIGNIPRSFYFEVKSSATIEKTAYDQYKKMALHGSIVVIFFGKVSKGFITFKWNFIENIKMLNSAHQLDHYKKVSLNQKDIPIIENWFYPRLMNPSDYEEWKQTYSSSGTPYAAVDFSSLLSIFDFKKTIIDRLKSI